MKNFDELIYPIQRNFRFCLYDVLHADWKASLWTFIPLLVMGLLVVGSSIFFCKNVGRIETLQDAAEAVGVCGSSFAVFLKAIIMLQIRQEIVCFSDDIKQQYTKSLNDHPDITNVFARHFSSITKLYSSVLFTLPVLYLLTSLFGNGELKLPICIIIPFLPSHGWPFFHISYCIQISIMWFGINLAIGVELIALFYIQYVCCRIEILGHMVERWNVRLKCNYDSLSDAQENKFLFEEIVRYHSSTKQNMAKIKRIFSPMITATLLSNSIVICTCLFIIFMNPVLKMVSHIIVALSQTFMYCFVGNLIMKQNDVLVEKVMLVDIHLLSVSEGKAYVNVVQSACDPIKLQSYSLTVDMTLFFKVVKFAYSAFSLMRTRM